MRILRAWLLVSINTFRIQNGGIFMQSSQELDVMFPVRMSSKLKRDGQAAAEAMGMNFSQFIRQSIQRNINIAVEIEREVSTRLVRGAKGLP